MVKGVKLEIAPPPEKLSRPLVNSNPTNVDGEATLKIRCALEPSKMVRLFGISLAPPPDGYPPKTTVGSSIVICTGGK